MEAEYTKVPRRQSPGTKSVSKRLSIHQRDMEATGSQAERIIPQPANEIYSSEKVIPQSEYKQESEIVQESEIEVGVQNIDSENVSITRNLPKDVPKIESTEPVLKTDMYAIELNPYAKHTDDLRSESGKVEKVLQSHRTKEDPVVQSRKDEAEEFSLFSHRFQNVKHNRADSSLFDKLESSMKESKASSIGPGIDWASTGLYRLFNLQYQEHARGHPVIKDHKLIVTSLSKTLADFVFERYSSSKKNQDKEDSRAILNDVQANVGLKYIKEGIKKRFNRASIGDDSSDDNRYKNESDSDFDKKVQNYFKLGMETLRYLMDLLSLNKNYIKIINSYNPEVYEDVMKCLLR